MSVRTVNRTTGQPGSSTSGRTQSKCAPRWKPSRSSKAMSSNFHRVSVRHSGSAKWRASRRKKREKYSVLRKTSLSHECSGHGEIYEGGGTIVPDNFLKKRRNF